VSFAGFMQRVSQLDELNEMTAKSRIETEFEVLHRFTFFVQETLLKATNFVHLQRVELFVIFKSFAHYEISDKQVDW